MDDLISRQAAKNKIVFGINDKAYFGDTDIDWKVIDFLNSLPSVTPKEKTGMWINDWEMGMSECSCCGETYLWEDHKGTENFHYCPNCGARMVIE